MDSITIVLAFTVSFASVCRMTSGTVIQVEIACPGALTGDTSGVTLPLSGPSFEMGVERSNRLYAKFFNFTLTYLYEPNGTTASIVDSSSFLLSRWYYQQRVFGDSLKVVMAPGALDSSNVHQLTASWNIHFFQTVLSSTSNYHLPASPIITTMPGYINSMVRGLPKLLDKYNWRTLTVVTDVVNSQYAYKAVADRLLTSFKQNSGLTIISRNIAASQYEQPGSTYSTLLKDFANSSRIMLYLAYPDHVRRLMIDAFHLNMTQGDYVYMCLGSSPNEIALTFGNNSWNYGGDPQGQATRMAFRSLLVIINKEENITVDYDPILASARQMAFRRFGTPVELFDQELQIIAFRRKFPDSCSTVDMFVQVLNESLNTRGESFLRDGRKLAGKFLNRTFRLPLGNLTIDSHGNRMLPLVLSGFYGPEPDLIMSLWESMEGDTLFDETLNISLSWPGGRWPPPNEPKCGYGLNNKNCQAPEGLYTVVLATSLSVGAVAVISTAGVVA